MLGAPRLLQEAFALAVTREREALLPASGAPLPPLRRPSRLLNNFGGEEFVGLGRLWLNARHLSRYRPNLRQVVAEQEALTCDALPTVIEDGVRCGDFTTSDAPGACVVIPVAIDGLGAYANEEQPLTHPALDTLVFTTAERELGLAPGALRDGDRPGGTPGRRAERPRTGVSRRRAPGGAVRPPRPRAVRTPGAGTDLPPVRGP
ncbi:hypothetical protein GCM10010495_43910 [Kitasatospora herbaricolor]|uniref:TetR family transcriptional regulator n=1 Tax=Kitasatospora herbaricolor TaxID=68217 RepID=UPI00174A0018|nr:TetR family transcriptional regulator [Kitasatospora herbaricolor]MDQ0306064.1 hypothetical protein [Kitasatospora herbaricolor]GGV23570.1 hypothetical protein GCM10010495_43910 [Kitasatospora herbaricolor]